MICHSCKFENPHNSRFCRRCGIALEDQSAINEERFSYDPPDPYSWKGDDVNDVDDRGVRQRQAPPQPAPPPIRVGVKEGGEIRVTGILAPQHQGLVCPSCGGQMALSPIKRVSGAGWVVFGVLLVLFFPLAWIGLLIKKDIVFCLNCNSLFEMN